VPKEQLSFEGYRGSGPAVRGNDAGGQLQLGNYADLMQTAWFYVSDGNTLDEASGQRLADVADLVCRVWRNPDSSIWELPDQRHYTQGKIASWVALDCAAQLADRGELPAEGASRWREEARAVRDFVDRECWSDRRRAYVRNPGTTELDAALLLAARTGFLDGSDERLATTVDALRDELGSGALLYRYSGMQGEEGAFLACSFWLVEALAMTGRADEGAEIMDELIGLANDVGLYSEEMDPDTGELLGNFPQALTHLALVNAAFILAEERG
jgi:GH15 family glucan-1,4-alpha-glucosidase